MDNAQRRAAERAANKLLKEAGFNAQAQRIQADRARILKPATPIDFPEGLTNRERKAYRKEVMVSRGEAFVDHRGQLVTKIEQEIRTATQNKRNRKRALKMAGPPVSKNRRPKQEPQS